MPSDRLRSTLYHSIPKPATRPPPLWQAAAALDPAAVRAAPEARATRPPPLWRAAAALDPAAVRAAPEARAPMTSAVLAGWICVGIGLLTAWFFPLAHVFFSMAIILAIVAMATHQVRAGLLLLAGSLASIGVCVILFIGGLALLIGGALHAATKPPRAITSLPPSASTARVTMPAPNASYPVARAGTYGGNPQGGTSRRPDALTDVLNLLAAGRPEADIAAFAAGRLDPNRIGPSEITSLRAYGASASLIDALRRPRVYASEPATFTYAAPPPSDPDRMVITAPAPTANQGFAPPPPPPPPPPPVDYAARDREVANLKAQGDALDEQVRCIRDNPKDRRYWWHYSSPRFNGIDQAALDAYLKDLDRQRNDLRRQKWAVEGR